MKPTFSPHHFQPRRALRLALATTAIALAAGAAQTAFAMPGGGPGMHGGMMGGGMGMMGHRMERALDSVGATAEQKAQLRQIMDAARSDLKGMREGNRKLHEQMRALFTQPTVDARAVEALRQQVMAAHDQASKRMSQAMIDASRVLTPEQRKQLADRMDQQRSMMQRHRAERESLEGGGPRRP
jgi:Spy/CpxP family protein refolding chaperone